MLKMFIIPTSHISRQAMDKMKQVGCGDWLDVLFEKCCQRERAMLELHKNRQPLVRTPIMQQHVRHIREDESRQQLSQDVQQNDTVCPICDELIDPSIGESMSILCKGPCSSWLHRQCAGVRKADLEDALKDWCILLLLMQNVQQ